MLDERRVEDLMNVLDLSLAVGQGTTYRIISICLAHDGGLLFAIVKKVLCRPLPRMSLASSNTDVASHLRTRCGPPAVVTMAMLDPYSRMDIGNDPDVMLFVATDL